MADALAAIGPFLLQLDSHAVGAPFRHDRTLMALSMIAALAALLAALELSERARAHAARGSLWWLMACGALLGAGVWTSHQIGLLAFQSTLTRGWDEAIATMSGLLAAGVGTLAGVVCGPKPSWARAAPAGAFFSLGMAAMHYLGMLGLQLDGLLSYRPIPALGALVGSMTVCIVGFRLGFGLPALGARLVTALVLSAAVASLHYIEMAAVVVSPRPSFLPAGAVPTPIGMAVTIAVVMSASSAVAFLAAGMSRRGRPLAPEGQPGEGMDDAAVVVLPRPPASQSDEGVVVLPSRPLKRP